MLQISERDGAVIFAVRVVRLTAPPVDGRANEALRRILAEVLNVPIAAVRILAGETSRTKRVAVSGVSSAQVLALWPVSQKASG